jgi:erythromycin esterase
MQYLVENKGFTAIAIESGIVEGRTVHDYVAGGPGDLPTVLAQGISWTFDQLPQNADLVRWLRKYNENPRHRRKINFYGFDVAGSPGNPMANRGMETALTEALAYLTRVDGEAASTLHAQIDRLLPSIRLDTRPTYDGPGYEKLGQADRDTLSAAITDLITLMERREAAYMAASSPSDYRWAYRYAIGARQADNWLRRVPVGWARSMEKMDFFPEATDIRDRAQADNLDWILREEGPSGKVLVYAARYHLSTMPVNSTHYSSGSGYQPQQVAGTYLRRRLGDRLLTIGNLIGKGDIGCAGFKMAWQPAPPESIDGLAGELGHPLFLLDLRKAPADVSSWLNQEHQLGPAEGALKIRIGRAFDILFYLATVSPACRD